MKVKNYLLVLSVLAGLLIVPAGCSHKRIETSERLEEEAEVVKIVSLQTHCKEKKYNSTYFNKRIVDNSIPIEISIPNVWILILRCEHDSNFIIRSDDDNMLNYEALNLFPKLEIGQKVIVTYREIYKNYYGNYKLKRSRLIGYKYLSVKLK